MLCTAGFYVPMRSAEFYILVDNRYGKIFPCSFYYSKFSNSLSVPGELLCSQHWVFMAAALASHTCTFLNLCYRHGYQTLHKSRWRKNWLYKTWGSLFLQTGSVYSLYKVSVKLVKSANKRKHCVGSVGSLNDAKSLKLLPCSRCPGSPAVGISIFSQPYPGKPQWYKA